jgi:hypothetical protein
MNVHEDENHVAYLVPLYLLRIISAAELRVSSRAMRCG